MFWDGESSGTLAFSLESVNKYFLFVSGCIAFNDISTEQLVNYAK